MIRQLLIWVFACLQSLCFGEEMLDAIELPRNLIESVALREPDQLTILHRSPAALPIQRWVTAISGEAISDGSLQVPLQALLNQARQQIDTFQPVVTRNLSPGRLRAERRNFFQVTRPICLIGDDAFSREWLQRHHARLVALRAVCLVVNVASESALVSLQSEAAIPFIPVPGDAFATQLGVRRYPALITTSGIEQ